MYLSWHHKSGIEFSFSRMKLPVMWKESRVKTRTIVCSSTKTIITTSDINYFTMGDGSIGVRNGKEEWDSILPTWRSTK